MNIPYLPNQQMPLAFKRALEQAADYRVPVTPEPFRLAPGKLGTYGGKLYLGVNGGPPLVFDPSGGGGAGAGDSAQPGGPGVTSHDQLTGVTANQHHDQANELASSTALGADHTVAGLTAGHVMTALSPTTAAFQAHAASANEKVKVSADDTTAGYLNGKLVAGANISLTEGSGGGNETLTVAATGIPAADDHKAMVSSDDTTPGYLEDKITVSGGVTKSTTSPAGNEKVDLAVHAQSHELASETALGADHTVSGLTSGHVLTATGAATAAFQALGVGAHNVLSTSHGDAVTASVVKGDILIGNATPKIDRLAAGNNGEVVSWKSGLPVARRSFDDICENMLYLALSAGLNPSGGASAYLTYQMGLAATDNDSIAAFTNTWTAVASSYRQSTEAQNGVCTFYFTGDGLQITMPATVAGYKCRVNVDGDVEDWVQSGSATYTYGDPLTYGVHKVIMDMQAGYTGFRVGQIRPKQYPYAGQGVSGDIGKILYGPPWMLVTSLGKGPTDGGATYTRDHYGEQIVGRVPLGTTWAETLLARSAVAMSGLSMPGENGMLRHPIHSGGSGGADGRGDFGRPGQSIKLSATGGTRGLLAQTTAVADDLEIYAFGLTSSIYRVCVWPCIVRITTAGEGSAFTAGDLAFCLLTDMASAASTQGRVVMLLATYAGVAADFFKIPTTLL